MSLDFLEFMQNEIPICQNCNYDLVLIARRRKFKCAKCSRLFLQKRTEFQNFQRWNKKQRELDSHNFSLLLKQREDSLNERKLLRGFRLLFKDRVKLTLKGRRKYYEKNKERLIAYTLDWKKRNKDKINQKNRENRHKSLEIIRQRDRLSKWRERHKLMALQYLKINGYNPYDIGLDDSFSTFGL
tara:strand:+ start:709 stop:1263 length:555 start_codon:yes stop_codon:yes gene_type:complete